MNKKKSKTQLQLKIVQFVFCRHVRISPIFIGKSTEKKNKKEINWHRLRTETTTYTQKTVQFHKQNMTLTKAVDQTTILHGDRAK